MSSTTGPATAPSRSCAASSRRERRRAGERRPGSSAQPRRGTRQRGLARLPRPGRRLAAGPPRQDGRSDGSGVGGSRHLRFKNRRRRRSVRAGRAQDPHSPKRRVAAALARERRCVRLKPADRARTLEALGGFDASLGPMTDWEFLVRLRAAEVRHAVIDEPLVEYRWHEANATRDLDAVEESLKRATELILDDTGTHYRSRPGRRTAVCTRCTRSRRCALATVHGPSTGARATWLDPSWVPFSARRALARRLRPSPAG